MNRLAACLRSPLVRRPRLLVRKVGDRLGLRHAGASPVPAPPEALRGDLPGIVLPRLRSWVGACDLHDEPFPLQRVFQQDWPPAQLEAWCCNGPPGTRDITGDIKLIWDYGRGHAFALNALRATAPFDPAARAAAEGLRAWLAANDDRRGPAWNSAMDMALRAVNWLAADAALEGGLARALGEPEWNRLLWELGHRIERGLEVRLLTTNNHYLSELLGLAWLGAYFRATSTGARWQIFARHEMESALLAQTYADGGLHEASLPYHVFVTEMALLFLLVQETPPAARWLDRLRRMVEITANAGSECGAVFQVGDSDGGRVLPLEFVSRSLGHAAVVTRLAATLGLSATRAAAAVYPDSGWAMLRRGPVEAHLEFGGWGPFGIGGHAHNDLLSVCLNWNGEPLVVDPGSALYTPDPILRNRYRSTAAHNTVQLGEREQVPLPEPDAKHVFVFCGPRRPCTVIQQEADAVTVENLHAAAGLASRHQRRMTINGSALLIQDTVTAPPGTPCTWSFHLAPGVTAQLAEGRALLTTGAVQVSLSWDLPALDAEVETDEVSPFYGTRTPALCLRFRAPVGPRQSVNWSFAPA